MQITGPDGGPIRIEEGLNQIRACYGLEAAAKGALLVTGNSQHIDTDDSIPVEAVPEGAERG